jgi:glutathione S-transferase
MAAHRAGLDFDAYQVDLKTHTFQTASGPKDFYAVNPKGNVPCLVLPDGTVLNENVATLSWIADQNLSAKNGAANGTTERATLLNTLSFLASELHASFGLIFGGQTPEQKAWGKTRVERALGLVEKWALADKQYLAGAELSVADLYAHVVIGWAEIPFIAVDLKPFPKTLAYLNRVRGHADVVAAQAAIKINPVGTKHGAAASPAAK